MKMNDSKFDSLIKSSRALGNVNGEEGGPKNRSRDGASTFGP